MKMNEMTLHALLKILRTHPGKVTTLLEDLYAALKSNEKQVRAYLELADIENLRAESKRCADRFFRGIPVAVKDNIQTMGFNTTCGSQFLSNFSSIYDSTAVRRLKKAGAPVLGKTNLDEFAMGSSTENSALQITRNPRDLSRVPGGSSGGSAAAVAAHEAIFALGSDTGGSVRQPASFCGVVGLKPTYGLVSRYGLTAFASSFDQIGPITKDVYDSGLVLNVIAGGDARDSTSVPSSDFDYTAGIDKGIEDLKLGFPREYFGDELHPTIADLSSDWKSTLSGLGAEITEVGLPHTEYALPAYYLCVCSEASANLARFDGVRYTSRAECETVDELFSQSRDEGFGPEVKRRIMLGTYALSAGYYDKFYRKAQKARRLIKNDFDRVFDEVDLIVTPTTPSPAFPIGEKIEDPLQMYLSDIFMVTANLAGIPAISIPGGSAEGLPVGMQIMGPGLSEPVLLRAARSFEQNFDTSH